MQVECRTKQTCFFLCRGAAYLRFHGKDNASRELNKTNVFVFYVEMLLIFAYMANIIDSRYCSKCFFSL